MKRKRSKFVLAPEATATSVRSRAPLRPTQAFAPATASAPAGSSTTRVSSNTSLIAAHISSVSTSTMSSTNRRHRRNVLLSHFLDRDAVGEEPDLFEAHAPAFLQRARHRVRVHRLDPDHFHRRTHALHVGRDAGDEAAAAHRNEDRIGVGLLTQDLHADRALPGDHLRIVVRMDEHEATLLLELDGLGVRVGVGVAVQHHLRAARGDRFNLDARRRHRHHDDRAAAKRCAASATPCA
jgi:hypothetical protein